MRMECHRPGTRGRARALVRVCACGCVWEHCSRDAMLRSATASLGVYELGQLRWASANGGIDLREYASEQMRPQTRRTHSSWMRAVTLARFYCFDIMY